MWGSDRSPEPYYCVSFLPKRATAPAAAATSAVYVPPPAVRRGGDNAALGERWKGAPDGPAVLATHGDDGHVFLPELACSACGEALDAGSIRVVPQDRSHSGAVTVEG